MLLQIVLKGTIYIVAGSFLILVSQKKGQYLFKIEINSKQYWYNYKHVLLFDT